MSKPSQAELLKQAREREAREASEGVLQYNARFERAFDMGGGKVGRGKASGSRSGEQADVSGIGQTESVSGSVSASNSATGEPSLPTRSETAEIAATASPTSPRKSSTSGSQSSGRRTPNQGSSTPDNVKKVNITMSSTSKSSDGATAVGNASPRQSRSKKASKQHSTLSSSDPDDYDEHGEQKSDSHASSASSHRKHHHHKDVSDQEASLSSHLDDDASTESQRRSKASKAPGTPPRTPRGGGSDFVANVTSASHHHDHTSSSSSKQKHKRFHGDIDEDGATSPSPCLDASSSASGDARSLELQQSQRDLDTFFAEDDGELIRRWHEYDASAHKMALQVLAGSGLAIANSAGSLAISGSQSSDKNSPPPKNTQRHPPLRSTNSSSNNPQRSNLSQSDIIQSGSRANSWAHPVNSSAPSKSKSSSNTSRSRLQRRQIVMLDGESPKSTSGATINAAKISHLTIDYLIHLVADTQLSQDKSFLDSLILAHDYFIKSPDLLAVLIHIYRSSQDCASAPGSPRSSHTTASTHSSHNALPSIYSPRSQDSPDSDDSDSDRNGTHRESKPTSPTSSTEASSETNEGSMTPTSGAMPSAPPGKLQTRSLSEFLDAASSGNVSGSSISLVGGSSNEDLGQALKRMRTINILKKLIEMRFYNLRRSPTFSSLLQRFVVELLASSEESENRFGDVLKAAMKTNAAFVREDDTSLEAPAPAPVLQEKYSSSNITSIRYKSASARKSLDDFSPVEIARQITLIDFANWNSIPLSELAHAAFNAKDATERCPRITTCTNRFNDLAAWVSSTVVLASKKKHRIAVLTKFLQVMDELKRLQNFHALMAFYSALNQAAILRLRKTWKGVSSRVMVIWNGINKFFDNSQDFKVYREYVKSADPPCIPYMGFILGGLTFVEEFPTFIVEENDPQETSAPSTPETRRKRRRSSSKPSKARAEIQERSDKQKGEKPDRPERPPTPSRASPDRVERDRDRAASLRLHSYRLKSNSHSRHRDSDSAGADTENPEQEPTKHTRTRHFANELDNSVATSSDFTDAQSSVSSPRLSRRSSNPNFGATCTEMSNSDTESDDSLSWEERDHTKLRRVLREPIPATVIAEPSSKRSSHSSSPPRAQATERLSHSAVIPGSPDKVSSPKIRRNRTRTTAPEPLAAGQMFLNWRKMVMLSRAFADVLRFQRTRYDLVVVREIEKFVSELRQHSWFLDVSDLASMSQEIEPDSPESSSVRDTFSAVKETISAVLPSPDSKKKDKSKKDKNKARPTFEALLTDQILFSEFRKFLIAQYSHENLLFWEAVNKFKQVDLTLPQNKIKAMAAEIYGRFITGTIDDGAFTIGFSHDIKENVTKKMNTNDFDPFMFDGALQEVEHSLLKPSFGQFLNETQ